jgi:hypothetical protein
MVARPRIEGEEEEEGDDDVDEEVGGEEAPPVIRNVRVRAAERRGRRGIAAARPKPKHRDVSAPSSTTRRRRQAILSLFDRTCVVAQTMGSFCATDRCL